MLTPSDIRKRWRAGELGYRYREIQREIKAAANKAFEKFIKFYAECTRRAGKSSFGLMWLTEDCIQHPGGVSAFFAPVKEGLRDYILPIIADTYSDCPEDLRPVLDASLTLTFPNGSKILFRGSNNQTHRTKRGNAFRRAFVDEGRDVDDLDNLIDSVIIPSLFSTEGRAMISSTPADSEDHPLFEIKVAAEREGWYICRTIEDAARTDPDDFPRDRITLWEREIGDPIAWQREFMCRWVKDPTKTVIPEWDDKYVQAIERDEFYPHYHKYVGMDLGVRDKTAGLFAYYDFQSAKLIVLADFAAQDAEVRTDKIAEIIKSEERRLEFQVIHDRKDPKYHILAQHEKVYRRVADNNNPLFLTDLNALYGLDFFGTRKDELPAMVNLLREWVKDGRIIVAPECKEVIGCLTNAVWDAHKKELARSKTYGHFDALMALVYLVRNVDTQTNPIPPFFNKSWATNAGVPIDANYPQRPQTVMAHALQPKTGRDEARRDFVRGR